MNPRAARFAFGNLIFAEGHGRGWKVICPRCKREKIVTSNKGQALPPEVVMKKFQQNGWQIGRNEDEDLCPECNLTAALERRAKAEAKRSETHQSNGADHGEVQKEPDAIARRPLSNEPAVLIVLAMIDQMETLLLRFDELDDDSRRVLSKPLAELARFIQDILSEREPKKSELYTWLENLGKC